MERIRIMNKRLEQFLAAENISQSQFADSIGVARASVSHILAGRNKPGFDFIESMSRHFPALNIEWLILGNGKMYKSAGSPTPEITPAVHSEPLFDSFFDNNPALPEETVNPAITAPDPVQAPQPDSPPTQRRNTESQTSSNKQQSSKNQRHISKIVVFYDDNTYQELK